MEERKQALDGLAFINTKEASSEMLTLAQLEDDEALKGQAVWWLINRANNHWKDHGLMTALKEKGIYDPDKVVVQEITVPDPETSTISNLPSVEEIAKITTENSKTIFGV